MFKHNEKVVIISSRVEPLKELDKFMVIAFYEQMDNDAILTLSLTGDEDQSQRDFFIKQFSDPTSPYNVGYLSMQAGGTGISL